MVIIIIYIFFFKKELRSGANSLVNGSGAGLLLLVVAGAYKGALFLFF